MYNRSSSEIFGSSDGEFLTTKNQTMAHATPVEPAWEGEKILVKRSRASLDKTKRPTIQYFTYTPTMRNFKEIWIVDMLWCSSIISALDFRTKVRSLWFKTWSLHHQLGCIFRQTSITLLLQPRYINRTHWTIRAGILAKCWGWGGVGYHAIQSRGSNASTVVEILFSQMQTPALRTDLEKPTGYSICWIKDFHSFWKNRGAV